MHSNVPKYLNQTSIPRLHNCCGEWERWDPVNWFNHTSWVAIVTQTDRPKSVRNRCVIEVFVAFCVVTFSVGVGAFVIGMSQISSFFSFFSHYSYRKYAAIFITSLINLFQIALRLRGVFWFGGVCVLSFDFRISGWYRGFQISFFFSSC